MPEREGYAPTDAEQFRFPESEAGAKQPQPSTTPAEQEKILTDKPELSVASQTEEKHPQPSDSIDAELAPYQQEAQQEVVRETTRALGDFWELLPRRGQLEKKDVEGLIDHTDLAVLTSVPRRELTAAIRNQRLNEKPKPEFITKGLDILGTWIHLEALKRGGDRWLARPKNTDTRR
ncbi:MAG: hypothetical protein HY567_00785 [Candidatus Kerfeldbacteria bacterium]|nr:hypothetical protein [Candidatus Kerfeldbacteria bacterium]